MDEHEAAAQRMEQKCFADTGQSLLDLPDIVLLKICQKLSDPFDLMSLGSTCRYLHEFTSSKSLWMHTALSWCQGMWHCLPNKAYSGPEDPKQWLFHLLRLCMKERSSNRERLLFENHEIWDRIRDNHFACKVSMLGWTYKAINEKVSPFVLRRLWLYDMALYRRQCPKMDFTQPGLVLSPVCVSQLASLGRAQEYDLRGRKQPYVDAYHYVTLCFSSVSWSEKLFSRSPAGSICPMLVCPSRDGYALESSGTDGLVTCVSYVLERHLARACLRGRETVVRMAAKIQQACKALRYAYGNHALEARAKWPNCTVANAIINMSEQGWPDLASWQTDLDPMGLHWREVISECAALLKEHGTLDAIVDKARIRWRRSLLFDIEGVLGRSGTTTVTRINLTDCDAMGGDNTRQDMAAAAFVSPSGVLVTWQLLGKGSY
ncbi:hypothetical protein HPB49_002075 [Dermacentor silvarum]|uniref:Uncharacterized protein n=1 Tax=Dermacentor silvarum TaxID=543639 RepID=A0ACB8D2A3_DERSI|nr:uncharacterized protein LOC119446274 [Dermacentor silvarum]KAH7958493.1 hypothetical protein HPB49_002075 [Dermacentor silvarum]